MVAQRHRIGDCSMPARSSTSEVELRPGRPASRRAREQAILDAAIDLVAEVGYDAMSIEAVAVRAKSSKATIYRRWPGKAELVAEAMRRRAEPVLEDLPDTGQPPRRPAGPGAAHVRQHGGRRRRAHVRPGRRRPQRR